MHYARVFLAALKRLEAAAADTTAQQLRDSTEAHRAALLESVGVPSAREVSGGGNTSMSAGRGALLPSPHWCKDWHFCHEAGNYRCSTSYVPVAGEGGSNLLDMISDRTPVLNRDVKELEGQPTQGHWAVTLNEVYPFLFDYFKIPDEDGKHKPIDRKWVLVGNSESGPIDLEFETRGNPTTDSSDDSPESVTNAQAVVCSRSIIDMVKLNDTEAVRFKMDGEVTSAQEMPEHVYTDHSDCVMLDHQLRVGRHTLSVEALKADGPPVGISHVIYPA